MEALFEQIPKSRGLKVVFTKNLTVTLAKKKQVLNLAENDLSLVDAGLIAQAVVALEEIDLTSSNLNAAQVDIDP